MSTSSLVLQGGEAKLNAFGELIGVFGYDAAKAIGGVLLDSINGAQTRLPMLRPVEHLQLSMLETERIDGFAEEGVISVNISPSLVDDQEYVIRTIPQMIEHEVAHIAHGQHNPRFTSGLETQHDRLLAAAFKEGIARHAEQSLSPSYTAYGYQLRRGIVARGALVYTAIEQLEGLRQNESSELYYDFLFGEVGLPLDGYQIGEYAITKIVAEHGLSMSELMDAPYQDLTTLFEYTSP